MGDLCDSATAINQTLFNEGAAFEGETLWLYGKDDPYYSIDHSKENFEAFRKAGGSGNFREFAVRGKGSGHWVGSIPPLWTQPVSTYLESIAGSRRNN